MAAFRKKIFVLVLVCAGLLVVFNDCGSDAYNISAPSVAKFVATGYPQYASSAGGSTITLNGIGFTPQTQVLVGGLPCQSLHYNSSTVVTCVAPAHSVGNAPITLVSPGGQLVTQSQAVVMYGEYFTWMGGSDLTGRFGDYGLLGVPAASNVPGARSGAVGLTDKAGNLWLFGGYGYDNGSDAGAFDLNDLWKFDGTNWTWVAGSNIAYNQKLNSPSYGLAGVAAGTNVIGARNSASGWIDLNGNIWIFGGIGYGSGGASGFLNDLWEFNGINWIWIVGGTAPNLPGTYGTMGVAGTPTTAPNVPGSRNGSASWTDTSHNFWLFGGAAYGNPASLFCNDLWKFNGTFWIWMGGSNTCNSPGVYGTKNIGAAKNIPPPRAKAVTWTDTGGNFWLFGGQTSDDPITYLNDLWKFDGTNWIWISGSAVGNQVGVYGTQGIADSANVPGSRYGSASWVDSHGNLWLFGGSGLDPTGADSPLNDLWKFDGTNWTSVSGSNLISGPDSYGTLGLPAVGNWPIERYQPVNWVDPIGNFWLFGGIYGGVYKNDLWRFQP